MSMCECPQCGRKFIGLTAFDKHQDVDYSRRHAVECMDPAGLGMEVNERGVWRILADASSRLRLEKMRAERSSPGVNECGPS